MRLFNGSYGRTVVGSAKLDDSLTLPDSSGIGYSFVLSLLDVPNGDRCTLYLKLWAVALSDYELDLLRVEAEVNDEAV